jgi:hypothetical protein
MRVVAISLALSVMTLMPVFARLGDSPVQTTARYGQPVASTGQPGEQTSTQTYEVSGLEVTCGYVGGKTEMETYARDGRGFSSEEVEALLRTNGSKRLQWTLPKNGYVDGTYTRSDGATAVLTGNKLAIQTSKWDAAQAADQSAQTAKDSSTANATNGDDPNYTLGSSTNAASFEPPAETNGAPAVTTNAP